MTSKKQARDYEKRRQEKLQLKIDARATARKKRQRSAAWGLLGVFALLALLGIAWYGSTHWWGDSAEPGAEPTVTVPGVTVTTSPTPGLEFVDGWAGSSTPPPATLAEGRSWTAVIDTSQGPITVELDGAAAPQAVSSFLALAGEGFFNGTECHRLVTQGIFVLQCGDPLGTGMGGPAYRFGPVENDPDDNAYPAGTLAMARQGNDGNSMGSQFFIVYDDSSIPPDSAGGYTVFGTVTQGLDIVEAVASGGTITGDPDGRPAISIIISEVTAS